MGRSELATVVRQNCVPLGEPEYGQSLLEESVDAFQTIGDICHSTEPLAVLGRIARNRGDYARAIELYGKCLEIDRRMEFRSHEAIAMLGLGLTVLQQGDYRRAAELFIVMLEVLKLRGSPVLLMQWLIAIAQISREFGKPTAAARLLGAADTSLDPFRAKGIFMPVTGELYKRVSNNVRVELGEETFAQYWQYRKSH